jgi:hypothetical protein
MNLFAAPSVIKATTSSTDLLVESIFGGKLCDISTRWRVIPRYDRSVREFESELIQGTFKEFYQWVSVTSALHRSNPFRDIPSFLSGSVSLYADYKYFHEVFLEVIDTDDDNDEQTCSNDPTIVCRDSALYINDSSIGTQHKVFDWAEMGVPNVTAASSTFWMGSNGSHTPLHYDSYGNNVIMQLYGTKRWCIWYPTEANCAVLSPTRIPYEESSLYADTSRFDPMREEDMARHPPDFTITLHRGDVLYLPKHCWHFVFTVRCYAMLFTIHHIYL